MTVWIAAWLPFSLALLFLTVPGIVIAMAAGLRSMSVLALAPVLSISVLSVTAIGAPLVGLSWGIITAGLGTLLTAGATLLIRRVFAKKFGGSTALTRFSYPFTPASTVALVLGAAVLLYRLVRIFGSPDYVSQTADNIFHLNAVRYVLESGSASSLALGAASGGSPTFYPAAWHGLAALIAQSSGASIPVAVASLNLVIGCVVWPLSMWFLCRTLFGGSAAMNVAFAVLISSFSAFPYLLIDWGVLYPNYLGIAALPAVFGIAILLFRHRGFASIQGAILSWLALVGLAGITLSHPNSLLTLIVLTVPYLVGRLRRPSLRANLVRPLDKAARLPILGSVLLAVALCAGWFVLRPFPYTSFNITWPPYQSTAQAVGEVLLTTHSARKAAWGTGVLFVLGLWQALTHRGYRWMAWCAGLWGFLMVVVSAWQPSLLRAFLTGGWYDDYKRIAAGLVLIALPLSVLGFIGVVNLLKKLIGRLPKVSGPLASVVSLLLIAAPTAVIAHTGSIRNAANAASSNYSLRPGSPIMSPDELRLYEELDSLVPKDKVVAGNPWDGSAWAYFVSGRRVLFPHVLPSMTKDSLLIASSFREAVSKPEVCQASKRLGVEYALNSDELIYLPGNPNNRNYPGLERLDEAPGFKEIARVGANRLYKLEGC